MSEESDRAVAPSVRRQRGQLRRRVVSKDVSRQLRRSPSTVICTLSLITGLGYGMVEARERNGGRLTVPSNAHACRTASQSPVLPVTSWIPINSTCVLCTRVVASDSLLTWSPCRRALRWAPSQACAGFVGDWAAKASDTENKSHPPVCNVSLPAELGRHGQPAGRPAVVHSLPRMPFCQRASLVS
jgi:hypothetical protein